MSTFAITGASGRLGRLAVHELLARGVPASDLVAVVRTSAKAADLAELGVHVRQADYSSPRDLPDALAGVDRLLLVSSNEPGQRLAHHRNVIAAAAAAGVARAVYTSMLNASDTTNPLAGEHQDTERALQESGVPHTVLRPGWYTENYTEQLPQYLQRHEIVGAAGSGRISAATRQDYAAAAAVALLADQAGNRTYELGGPAFDLRELAEVITAVTGTPVTYRDLPVEQFVSWLQAAGLDEQSAQFVAALDASIAHGDLHTESDDLRLLLGRDPTPLVDVVRATHSGGPGVHPSRVGTVGLIGAGNIGATVARLAIDGGYDVVLSNSRGPETLAALVEQLGPHARAATPTEAAAAADIAIVTVPLKAYRDTPVEPLAGKVVIDTTNYYPDRDGRIGELDEERTTTSELVQSHLSTSHVVKTLSSVFYAHLPALARPHGSPQRSAVPIAGDDEAAKKTVTAFLDAIGFDAHDVGPLSEGWRYQRDAMGYAHLPFEDPRPADAEHLSSLLAQAERYRDM